MGLKTPDDVHYGLASEKTTARKTVLGRARGQNPQRFPTSNRKILENPDSACTYKPVEKSEMTLAT